MNGVARRFAVDRTFVDEDGVRWVIDFKTSWHEGDVDAFIAGERLRYEAQLDAYARLMGGAEVAVRLDRSGVQLASIGV